jgi:excisionase family DNA binding protein
MSEKELLTADEAAEKLRIAKRTLLRWARENRIESVRVSPKVVLFAPEAIDEFVTSKSKKIEYAPKNHQEVGRKTASPYPRKKGGDRRTSGESWRDLRQEVSSWES